MPVVEPVTVIRLPSRAPVMVIIGRTGATGVTACDGAEDADQPAPFSACTVNVYATPFVRPATVHDSPDVKHVPPLGDDVAR